LVKASKFQLYTHFKAFAKLQKREYKFLY